MPLGLDPTSGLTIDPVTLQGIVQALRTGGGSPIGPTPGQAMVADALARKRTPVTPDPAMLENMKRVFGSSYVAPPENMFPEREPSSNRFFEDRNAINPHTGNEYSSEYVGTGYKSPADAVKKTTVDPRQGDVFRQQPTGSPYPSGEAVPYRKLMAESVAAKPDPLAGIAVGPEKNMTEQQAKYTGFVDRASAAMPIIEEYGKSLTDPVARMKAGVPFFGNAMKDDDYRKAELAGEVFIMSILRPDTGATITAEEMSRYSNTFLPQAFDTQTQIDMKTEMRKTAVQGMQLGLPKDAILSLVNAGVKLVGPTKPADARKNKYGLE